MAFLRSLPGALATLCGLSLLLSLVPGWQVVAYAAVAFGAYSAVVAAIESVRRREVDVNLLMVLAAAGAVAVGRPLDAGVLLFLFSLSGALEELAMSRTKNAIADLVRLRPDEAILVTAQGERKVPIGELRPGDVVRVAPYESIPVDGVVREGRSAVDASAMTGESAEVSIVPGSSVLGGTRNLSGSFTMDVATAVGTSTLDKIVSLVQEAQDNKASGEKISAWFGARYTVFVLVAFGLSLVVRLSLREPASRAFYDSLTLLVALSPCALVISTPASTLSALAFAARNGILVRGGEFIERAGTIDTLALDKTGTLTVGKPRLAEICLCEAVEHVSPGGKALSEAGCDEGACWHGEGDLSPEAGEILLAAASVERYSAHPLAHAILEAASTFGVSIPEPEDEQAEPGIGVSGVVGGKVVTVGQMRGLLAKGVQVPVAFQAHLANLQSKGLTVATVSVGGRLGALGFIDAPRPEAPNFLREAASAGVRSVAMITGDTPQTAHTVAESLGIKEVYAGVLPAEKTEKIAEMTGKGMKVMMVGDGINDAPALAKATVGVAMGGLGSDIAMNAADVVLMHDRLDRIPLLMRLGRATNLTIKVNLLFASGTIIVLTVLSLMGRLPLPLAVVGHEGSTVLVILNGLRLLRGPQPVR